MSTDCSEYSSHDAVMQIRSHCSHEPLTLLGLLRIRLGRLQHLQLRMPHARVEHIAWLCPIVPDLVHERIIKQNDLAFLPRPARRTMQRKRN